MLLINKDIVSHIRVFNNTKGRLCKWRGTLEYVWMDTDYFKFLWLFKTPILNYPAGFYRNSKRRWVVNDAPTELRDGEYVFNNAIWTKPRIEIYAGDHLIKTMYFENRHDALEFCGEKFSNVNIHIND